MANRGFITGFEAGLIGSITGSDVSAIAGAARSGSLGLRVAATSGVRSQVGINIPGSGAWFSQFIRMYVRLISLPGTARFIAGETSAAVGSSDLGLRLNTDGSLTYCLGNGTNVIATTSLLTLNTWYRVEIGADSLTDARCLKLNGTMQGSGWGTIPSESFSFNSWSMGALDTVAATFSLDIDDVAMDWEDFPGYGKTGLSVPSALQTDNANWTLTGAANKVAAVSDIASPDDDSGYILSPTNTTDEIIFTLSNPVPAGAIPKAAQTVVRAKRDGGTTNRIKVKPYVRGRTVSTLDTSAFSGGANYATTWGGFTNQTGFQRSSTSGYADQWHADDMAELRMGLLANSATNQIRVTGVGVEIEYDDRVGAVYDPYSIQFIAGFDSDLRDENQTSSSNAGATTSISAVHVKGSESTGALRANPGNNVSTGIWRVVMNNSILGSSDKGGSAAGWVYVDTRHTSGTPELLSVVAGFTTPILSIYMDTSGGIALRTSVDGVGSFSAANTIPLDTWVYIEIEWIIPTAATSAADGLFKCWVNGSLIINSTSHHVGSISASFGIQVGSSIAVPGGWDVYYDEWYGGYGWLHADSGARVTTLRPSAVDTAGSGFTSVGNADHALAMAEAQADDDTSYLVIPASTSDTEWYALADLPGAANQVHSYLLTIRTKRDGGVNGAYVYGLKIDGGQDNTSGSSSSSYAAAQPGSNKPRAYATYRGRLTPSNINSATLMFQANHATASTRVTKSQVSLLYSETAAPADPDATPPATGIAVRSFIVV